MIWQLPRGSSPRQMWPLISKDFGGNLWSADPYSTEGQAWNPARHPGEPYPRYQRPPLPWQPWPDIPWKRPNRRQRRSGIMWAAPAFVQQVSGTSTGATTVVSSSITPTAGNCLVALIGFPTANTISTVADGTNLWTTPGNTNNASGAKCASYYANNVPATAVSITVTFNASTTNATIGVLEYSGVGAIAGNRSLADNHGGSTGNGTAVTTSATSQVSGSLFVSGVADMVGGITYTAGGSVTRRVSLTAPVGLAVGEQVGSTTSIAALASAWTASGTVQWAEDVIVLRPAGVQAANRLVSAGIASGGTLVTASYTPKLGAVLIAYVQTASTGKTTSSVADSTSSPANTWTAIVGASAVNASGGELSAWLCNGVVNAASQTFTATLSAASAGGITIIELTGVIPSATTIDAVLAGTGNGTAINHGPTAATVLANETALLAVGTPGAFTSYTNGGSTTLHAATSSANGSTAVQSLILNATGTQTQTGTLGATQQYSCLLITVKTAGVSLCQTVSATNASAALNPTLPFNCTPGNTLIAAGMMNNHTGFSGITGPTFTQFPSALANNASGGASDIWYALSIAGGKVSPTAAATTVAKAVIFYEISGLAAIDVVGTHTANDQAVTATSAQPNFLFELAVLASGDVGTGKAYTATSPATIEQADVTTNVDLMGALTCQFTVGAVPPAITMAGSIPTAAVQHSDSLATFKVAGSPAYYSSTVSETAAAAEAVSGSNAIHVTIPETSTAAETVTSSNAIHILINEVSQAIESVTEFVVGLEGALLKVWAQVKTQLDIWSRKKTKATLSTQVKTQLDVWASKSGLATPGVKMDTLNFDQGDIANVYGLFTDPTTGLPATPTQANFVARRPDGSIAVRKHYPTDPEVHLVSTGFFRTEVDTSTLGGSYLCRYYAPPGDPYQASEQVTIYVASDTLV